MATYQIKPKRTMPRYRLLPVYVKNITNILKRLASTRSATSSFTYAPHRHKWLERPVGYSPPVESQVLELVLKELGVLKGEVERNSHKAKKRFIVNSEKLRKKLRYMSQGELEKLIAEKLKHVYYMRGNILKAYLVAMRTETETLAPQL